VQNLVENVVGYLGETFVGMTAGACTALESTLSQQHIVEHVLRLLQLLGDVHVVVHSKHLRRLHRRQVLHIRTIRTTRASLLNYIRVKRLRMSWILKLTHLMHPGV